MKKDSLIFINHILESINLIDCFSKGLTKEKLSNNKLKQSAIIRQIEIIGEATKNLPKEFIEKYKEVPWKDIIGMRDKIVHQYFDIDINIIWNVLEINLPDLKKKIKIILKENRE
ncbi:MAG: DUF86 domain-containing protein [Candidatus Pacearchaeota archaeon]|nr:DUF86 domain-containing protein [Candidatus Pacearchaeota archaeon]